MKERLQKFLASSGVASRRTAEKLIAAGIVTVNGVRAVIGQSCDPEEDIIAVDGEVINPQKAPVYIALYKPRGIVTTMKDEHGRKTVWDLVSSCGTRVYPAGRLDLNSEGLVLMTNDGDVAMSIMHPANEIEKIYRCTVKGTDDTKIDALAAMNELEGERISPPKVTVLKKEADRTSLQITIHEGKNRQIRRMCEQVGLEVLRLKRDQIGPIRVQGLKPGEWRLLTAAEIHFLKSIGTQRASK